MEPRASLRYPGSEEAAGEVQRRLGARVELGPVAGEPKRAAGAVVREVGGRWWACAVSVSFPELEVVEEYSAPAEDVGRYVRGFRSFFEGEGLVRAVEGLRVRPEVVFFRGHGICHPRRCGLASHVGLVLDLPTVGCADRLLCGEADEPGRERGDWAPVMGPEGEVLGAAVRVQEGVRPVYVSPGHRCDVESAVRLTLAFAPRFRLPEPLRNARRQAAQRQAAQRQAARRRAARRQVAQRRAARQVEVD